MDFGVRLRRLREQHGLTQAELAFRLRTDAVSISRWERGVIPRLDTASRIARVFGVSIDWLVGDDDGEGASEAATGTDG